MPFQAPLSRMARFAKSFASLGSPTGAGQQTILRAMRTAVLRDVLAEEFRSSRGPDGPWKQTVRGKAALQSKKLVRAFTGKVLAGEVSFTGRVRRDWLEAHQKGHVFPPRQVGALKQYMTFNRRGKLSKNAVRNKVVRVGNVMVPIVKVQRGAFQRFASAHTVNQRDLPARPMVPDGAMPAWWEGKIATGVEAALARWAAKVAK